MKEELAKSVSAELARPVPPGVAAVVARLAEYGGGTVRTVLFYGSALRAGEMDGILDFYVVVDSLAAWHRRVLPALFGRVLPPNVEYWESEWQGRLLRAKVAVIDWRAFQRAFDIERVDTSIWARFAQPAAMPYARDEAAAAGAVACLVRGIVTAAWWAVRLGPESGRSVDYWNALFAHTYGAELRVEPASRARDLVGLASSRYEAMLVPALAAGATAVDHADGMIYPKLSASERNRARRAWARRRRAGKLLNLARLAKAAFTFRDGADYVAWKIERHSGHALRLTPWQRRHPILSGPAILLRLWRRGVVR